MRNFSLSVLKEKGFGNLSPGCSSIAEKSIVELSILAHVPVLSLPIRSPASFLSDAERPTLGSSPKRPAFFCTSPIWITPFKKVPLVMITFGAKYSFKSSVFTPLISLSSTISDVTVSCARSKFGVCKMVLRAITLYLSISICALEPRTAGPLDWFKILN
ncbi:hypothetical protein MNB_SV-12-1836 [hydrothermal vent metagenome]|uniref:Uncharacterized protein n=1 Tax=hydrothermal vent metagenome TaxID=652676 RepID=A0A1W1B9G3_9ZZZZ